MPKNASVPIVTIIGIAVGLLLGGVVVTESVFNIPGLGRLTVDSLLRRLSNYTGNDAIFFRNICNDNLLLYFYSFRPKNKHNNFENHLVS